MKHLVTLAAVAAASLAVATPAMAQRGPVYGQDEEARFDAAQQRFDREYGQFQQALERYRAYKSRPIAPPPPRPRRAAAIRAMTRATRNIMMLPATIARRPRAIRSAC